MEPNTVLETANSLLVHDVYAVCFTEYDGLDGLHSALAQLRKAYFSGGGKTVRVGRSDVIRGYAGKLSGKMSRRRLLWRKTAGGVVLEESFDHQGQHIVVYKDFQGVILHRCFFDREHRWIKSEYYEAGSPGSAKILFKPQESSGCVDRFDWLPDQKRYLCTPLYSLPYWSGQEVQSVLNDRFGEPQLLVATEEGELCFCPREERDARARALAALQNEAGLQAAAMESSGLESEDEAGPRIVFAGLGDYARIETDEDAEDAVAVGGEAAEGGQEVEEAGTVDGEAAGGKEAEDSEVAAENGEANESGTEVEEIEAETEAEAVDGEVTEGGEEIEEAEAEDGESAEGSENAEDAEAESGEEIEDAEAEDGEAAEGGENTEDAEAESEAGLEDQESAEAESGENPGGRGYFPTQVVENGRVVELPPQNGFGQQHYKDGSLSYAGFWKDEKRHGLGASFRNSDHVLHITSWNCGKPGPVVSLFDRDGNLRYGGRFVDGKKQGAGVSLRQADGSVFVGKWDQGKPTGIGAFIDPDGNLLYYGGWKNGKRHGRGTEFDKTGRMVFDGDWQDGKYYNGVLFQQLPDEELPEDFMPPRDFQS